MTKIEFYILQADASQGRLQLVDDLLHRSMRAGKAVHIHTCSARSCDSLRQRYREYTQGAQPVLSIDHTGEPDQHLQVLVNLAPEVPHFFSRFEKTLEIIDRDDTIKLLGRERYQFYRNRGYPLAHHDVGASAEQTPKQNRLEYFEPA
jgi:DNA polymerase-3 subunit chi